MPSKVPRALKRISARMAAKSWGPFVNHTYGGAVYAINDQVAMPYRWLTQKALNENPVRAMDTSTARQHLPKITQGEQAQAITAITTYTGLRRDRSGQEETWTELPGLQGVYTATASAVRSRSWTQLATWVQLGNAVLLSTNYRDRPLAALVPPRWVDERIDAGAPDVEQETLTWTTKDSLKDLISGIARNGAPHRHYDLKAGRHTVTAVDMDWLAQATGQAEITSTTRLPLAMSHPSPNPETDPRVALVPAPVAAQILKGVTEGRLKGLPKSESVTPEEE